jgi:O2-independent ubiquinone biosynthesis protein UbiV
MKLALGPLQYLWPRDRVLSFYEQAAGWPVETVYLGEVVCAKRRELRLEDWLDIGDGLAGEGMECEVLAWGRVPLAWSARCYTARAENRSKDSCDLACRHDPDGRLLRTRDGLPLLALNGIQVQSALTQNLAPHLDALAAAGVGTLRLSPQSEGMARVVAAFDALRRDGAGEAARDALVALAPVGTCDGYWRGEAGLQ